MTEDVSNRRGVAVNVCATVFFLAVLTWIIMFKCNLLTSDLRFGYTGKNFIPFKGIAKDKFWVECLLNAVAFVPLGYLVAALFNNRTMLAVTLVCFGLAVFYEAFQYFIRFGSLDITDALCNGAGGVIGGLLYCVIGKRLELFGINVPSALLLAACVPLTVFATVQTALVFPVYVS